MIGRASAPGSSANLGPGFDVIAIAWDMWCHASVEQAAEWSIVQGKDEWRPRDGDFVKRAAQTAGGPFRITLDNKVPRSRGLGSSSAVAAAVAAAAFRANGAEPSDDELFAIVTGLEGHADNAAAAVFGGLVLVDGTNRLSLRLHPDLAFLAAIPNAPLKTAEARAALPDFVTRPAMVRSLARFGSLLHGLETGSAEALAAAAGDELHEAPRAPLAPLSARLIEAARESGALHACWSGAGPTVLAICNDAELPTVSAALEETLGDAGRVTQLAVASAGWK